MRFKGLDIRPPRRSDPVEAYLGFICGLIDEEAYIVVDKKPTMKEEKAWLDERLRLIKKGEEIFLTAWDGKTHAGNCSARRNRGKEKGNIELGIAVVKAYRGRGLGEKLLRETIRLAEKRFEPKNIYLRVFSDNKIAQSLYRKVGFRRIAHFPAWTLHRGRYVGHDYMLLRKRGRA